MRTVSNRLSMQPTLVVSGLGLILLATLKLASFVDEAGRGDADVWAAEAPANVRDPFAETQTERRLKSLYREPLLAAALAPQAQAPNGGINRLESTVPEAAMKRAHAIYQERCASCHGDKGDGDGPGAFAIKPKPRNYTDVEWQKSVADDELAQAIVRGGAAIGKSYMMPANRDLKSKADVVDGLVLIIRSFAAR